MGLVDYSESDDSGSDSEQQTQPTTKPAQTLPNGKKPFQKLVDPSNKGKLIINLPPPGGKASTDTATDGPPAKRTKTTGSGVFSGFNSFLPPPKNTGIASAPKPSATQSKAPGIGLKTSSAAAFSRGTVDDIYNNEESGSSLSLPAPKRDAEPTIPEGQKPAHEVKLTGKPLMFKPLSVARSNKKKPTAKVAASITAATTAPKPTALGLTSAAPTPAVAAAPPPPKKVSLFSMHTEERSEPQAVSESDGTYRPLFETEDAYSAGVTSNYEEYAASYAQVNHQGASAGPSTDSLGNIADDLNLSAAERRELFGRGGHASMSAKKVVNFNMDDEYKHNETVRASGETQIHNPVRAIQGGKHSLRQLVQNVHNQREALEDSFAQGKNNRKEASGRYGW
ncbi:hypothetical protein VHEMI09446 [[Torrubiella] hemipterigena]|uniref:Stress activated map kinase interacting n=1 Tax=[Torrubiella] hemipterigena TaxID=1531966 RepID=A0A0A1TQB8_9HYPO|nr:hypothetical protein VHEMI09446 [[Torrubiella] hemipterigena]